MIMIRGFILMRGLASLIYYPATYGPTMSFYLRSTSFTRRVLIVPSLHARVHDIKASLEDRVFSEATLDPQ